jgi:hypothetical protein
MASLAADGRRVSALFEFDYGSMKIGVRLNLESS